MQAATPMVQGCTGSSVSTASGQGATLTSSRDFRTLEALNNVAKYAQATVARVTLARQNGALTFDVTDDGRGFDPAATGYGTGLQGMADRLEAIGGELRIRSAPGEGTTAAGSVSLTVGTGRSTSGQVPVVRSSDP